MSERNRRKKALLSQPQSKTAKGIAEGIGLLPDGSLNIFIPGTPPSRSPSRDGNATPQRPASMDVHNRKNLRQTPSASWLRLHGLEKREDGP
jgi:hypothetical protein